MQLQTLTPLIKDVLRAAHSAPEHALIRCREGWTSGTPGATVFTRRTINVMERDYLVTLDGDLHQQAKLTSKGEALARQLVVAERSRVDRR